MTPDVSIITPTYNRRASLDRLLEGLRQQTFPADHFEWVVIDDGSTDRTVDYLRQLELPFEVRVLQQAHAGPAEARNLGVAHARGRLVLFLDDDVLPAPTLVEEHVRTHGEATHRVVIGPMSPPRGWARPAWIKWDEETLQQQYRAMLGGEWACTPRQFYTANASLMRDRFLAAGGFDPRFKRAEDVELAFRLERAGASFAFNPRAEILHYASRSFAAWRRTPIQYGRYDVVMQREGTYPTLNRAFEEFYTRHPLNRMAISACLGRRWLRGATVAAMSGAVLSADVLGAERVARWALSSIFGVLYWQGVSEELGPRVVRRSMTARALLSTV